jgi:hypothetical protein
MLLAALAPGGRLTLAGVADNVKLGGGVTVRAMVTFLLRLPEVPVMVTVVETAAALPAAVRVTTLWPVVLAGAKLAVTPAGRPDAVSATVPPKPF